MSGELSSPACYASERHYGSIPPEQPAMSDVKDLKIAIIGAGKIIPEIKDLALTGSRHGRPRVRALLRQAGLPAH